jgi:acyl-CoA thioester hydrolase
MSKAGETIVRVRYAETDQMGVVYYANFFVWFEVARVELMRQMGFSYKQMELEDDSYVVVARANCTYKRPARFDDLIRIYTTVAEARRRTITFSYEVINDATGELIATGETLHVICDHNGRPKSLPEKYREYFPLGRLTDAATTGGARRP